MEPADVQEEELVAVPTSLGLLCRASYPHSPENVSPLTHSAQSPGYEAAGVTVHHVPSQSYELIGPRGCGPGLRLSIGVHLFLDVLELTRIQITDL